MSNIISADAARFAARQKTFTTGFVEGIVTPGIQSRMAFGAYDLEIFLGHFPNFTQETLDSVTQLLQKYGYSVSINNQILKVEWK